MIANAKTTTELMNEALQCSPCFSAFEDAYRQLYTAADLQAFIAKVIREKGLAKPDVINRANLDRTYGYQILRGVRKPTRGKLIQLAFGLRLSVGEAATLLQHAGYRPLYPKIQREAAIIFCLSKGYTYLDCTLFLDSLDD